MKTVVITGSSRGIGRGLAREFLALGCNVAICGRNEAALQTALAELSDQFGEERILAQPCDVTHFNQVQNLWDAAVEKFAQVDIWINNAGATTIPARLDQIPPPQIETTISAKLTGTLYGMRVALAGMVKQGHGAAYMMEGMGGRDDVQPGTIVLGCANRAIVYLKKGLRKEFSGTPLIIGTIRPGINVTEHLLHGVEHLSEERWAQTKKIFNILGDKPETTTPWLAQQILHNQKNGVCIKWMSTPKLIKRFALAPFSKRDLFAGYERPPAPKQKL